MILFVGPFALVLLSSARYRAAVARADGFGSLTWRPGSPGLALELLRTEATARPEPALERLRRQLQSFKGTTLAMLFGGVLITIAWADLAGFQEPFGYRPMEIEPVRVVFWSGALLAMAVTWFGWVWRRPQGFVRAFLVGLVAVIPWLSALVLIGPSLPG